MKYTVDLLLVGLCAVFLQVVVSKPLNYQQLASQGSPAQPDSLKTQPEQELEDLKTLTGQVGGSKPAGSVVPQTPPKPAISDDRIFQGAKQALRTAAAQAKQQQQQQQQPQQLQKQAVNKPYINQQDAVESYSDLDMNLDLTPKAVAEYLLITGDFQGFDSAMADLLNANIIKDDEAREYKDSVGWEYESLLKKLVDAKQQYLKEVLANMEPFPADPAPSNAPSDAPAAPSQEQKRSSTDASQQVAQSAGVTTEGDTNTDDADLSAALRKLQLKSLLEKEATLDELLEAIVEEYLLRGVEQENEAVSAPKASVKINPEEKQMEEMIELVAEAVRQGNQPSLQNEQQKQDPPASKPQDSSAEVQLSQVAQTNRQTQQQQQQQQQQPAAMNLAPAAAVQNTRGAAA